MLPSHRSGARLDLSRPLFSIAFLALGCVACSSLRANTPALSALSLASYSASAAIEGAWGFEEGSGTLVLDSSANGNDGVLEGGATRAAGRFGDALEVDGATGRVNLGGIDVSGSGLTLSLWFRADDLDAFDGRLIAKANGNNEGDSWWMLSTTRGPMPRFRLKTSVGGTTTLEPSLSNEAIVFTGEWMHVAGTYDGAMMRLYLNGVEVASVAKTGTIATDPSVDVWIGQNPDGAGLFDGRIDEVRIHDRALSALEIAAEMQEAIEPAAGDTSAPTTPTGLEAVDAEPTSIGLDWNESSDDYGVAYYRVFRDGAPIADTPFPHFMDSGLAQWTEFDYCVAAFDDAGNESGMSTIIAAATSGDPTGIEIDVWYGDTQRFGDIGIPQPWVNILGKVRTAPGRTITSLSYKLNGGTSKSLNIGPYPVSGPRRLYNPGDFNCDIATSSLENGANTVLITANDSSGAMLQKSVTVNYDPTKVWPLPSTTSWSTSVPLLDVCQPVDGLWAVEATNLRPIELGYDRLIAIGDELWTDYEVTVPITILAVDNAGFNPPSNNPAVGVLMRWPGHTPNGQQPHWGFIPLGALAWYKLASNGSHRLEILGNNLNLDSGGASVKNIQLLFNQRYIFKVRVENNGSGPLYRMKVWRDGDPEPGAWDIQNQETNSDPQQGCLLLVAHHVDALFGTTTVTAIGATGPQIVTQPQSQTVCSGSNVTFSVTATGDAPLSYAWKKNGTTSVGTNSSQLTLTSVGASDAASYHCVVTNPHGTATSNAATLTVNSPISITTQPQNASPCTGTTLSLTVAATGGSLTYQWKKNGGNISGATSATYSKTNVAAGDAGTYRCDVTNACGTVASADATVTVRTPPSITSQPLSTTVCPGDPLVLSVTATGTSPLSYAWTRNGSPVGGNSSSLVLSPADAGDAGSYQVTVTNACNSVASTTAIVTVNALVDVVLDPVSQSAPIGGSVTFTVAANGTEPLTYQWKKNGGDIGGATSASYTINPVGAGDAGSYTCVVTNDCGSDTSTAATLTVNGGPQITTQPQSQSKCVGESASFTVVATGSGALSYAWRKDGVPIPGATSATLAIASVALTDAGVYEVVVTDANGSKTSNPASLSVGTAPTITGQPQNTSVCQGSPIALSVTATGGGVGVWWNSAWSYRLPVTVGAGAHARTERPITTSVDLTDALADAGGAGAIDLNSLRVIEIDASGQILAADVPFQFDPGTGFNATTNAVGTLVVLLRGTTPASAQRFFHLYFDVTGHGFAPPSIPARVTVSTVTDEGQSSFRFITENATWYYQKQGAGFSSLVDANGNDWIGYHPTGTSDGAFRGIPNLVFPAGHFHPGATSGVTTLVSQGPIRAKVRSETTDGNWTVEWEIFPRHATMTILEKASNYWFLYEGTPGGALETTSDFVVRPDGTQTLTSVTWGGDLAGSEWCYFGDPGVGRSLFVAHHTDDAIHDSYRPMDGQMTVFGFGRQGTTSLLTAVPDKFTVGLIDGTQFTATSAAVRSAYTDVTISIGTAADRASAGGVALSYQWKKGGTNIPGANGSTFGIASAAPGDAGSYTVAVSSPCGTVTSNAATVTVTAGPAITSQPSPQNVCAGTTATFTVAATGSGLVYQWRKGGTNIPGANSASLVLSNVNAASAGSYDVVVSATCGSVTSSTATLTVKTATAITTQPANQGVCDGQPATFSVVATGQSLSYQWRKNGSNISGATSASLSIESASETDEGTYDVVVTGECGAVTSSPATLAVGAGPAISSQPSSTSACPGDPVSFTVVASGSGLGYQWRKNNANISGANASTFSIASAAKSDEGDYDVVVTSDCGTVTSSKASLAIGDGVAIVSQPSSATACVGSPASFTVGATGSSLTYQWRKGGTSIPGATSATYSIAAVSPGDAGSYSVVVSSPCAVQTSTAAALTVQSATAITAEPADAAQCSGSALNLGVTATGTSLTYQWRKGGTNIPGATSASLIVDPVIPDDSGSYDVVVTGACGAVVSRTAAVTVAEPPVITASPESRTVCAGASPSFQVTATGLGLAYQWQKDGTDIPGATGSVYSLGAATAADAGEYIVVVSNPCGSTPSAPATLEVLPGPAIVAPPMDQLVCAGEPAAFSVEAVSSGLAYQWRKDGIAIPGATSATLEIPAAEESDAGEYDVLVTNDCGSLRSSVARLDLVDGPVITQHPQSAAACFGTSITLSVAANGAGTPEYEWRKDGLSIAGATSAELSIDEFSADDVGIYEVIVTTSCGSTMSEPAELSVAAGCSGQFLRGDANQDGDIDISDPITILNYLFRGGVVITCLSSLDTNDDGGLDIAEAIFLLSYLFRGGVDAPPPNVLTGCGIDPTPDELGCESFICP